MSERAELRGGPETALMTSCCFFPSELLRSHAALLVGVISPHYTHHPPSGGSECKGLLTTITKRSLWNLPHCPRTLAGATLNCSTGRDRCTKL
jgi:hypothetical protein